MVLRMHLLEGPDKVHSAYYITKVSRKGKKKKKKAHHSEGIEPMISHIWPVLYHCTEIVVQLLAIIDFLNSI